MTGVCQKNKILTRSGVLYPYLFDAVNTSCDKYSYAYCRRRFITLIVQNTVFNLKQKNWIQQYGKSVSICDTTVNFTKNKSDIFSLLLRIDVVRNARAVFHRDPVKNVLQFIWFPFFF